ncbi:MAG: hypothetical protein EU549_00240 [Promethearchaeota archaeon]|nr:MAG: hypothetical protein EU549_00240 [Candidatus Lokiarchaeota archaeon]
MSWKMRKNNREIIEYLNILIEKIKDYYSIKCVIFFGSRARGDFSPHSDIDLIIVGNFRQKFINRADKIYEIHDWKLGLDVFCYRPQEFDELFHNGTVSALDAIDEGICLYGMDFFKKYERKLNKLKKRGLYKDPPVWVLPESMEVE